MCDYQSKRLFCEQGMTILRAIAIVAICTLLAASIGAGTGFGLGAFAPDYYRGVAVNGKEPWFDPISFGIGQGLSQGIVGGLATGLFLVATFSWRDVRLHGSAANPLPSDSDEAKSSLVAWRLFVFACLLLGFGLLLPAAGLVGIIIDGFSNNHHRYLEEGDAIARLVAADPAFSEIEILEDSRGGVYLSGDVATPADLARLRSAVVQAIGEGQAQKAMSGVGVKPPLPEMPAATERPELVAGRELADDLVSKILSDLRGQ
jgi:hypothetical protein